MIEGVSKLGLSFEGKEVVLGAHLREPRVLRQGLLGPARWVTREVLAVTCEITSVIEPPDPKPNSIPVLPKTVKKRVTKVTFRKDIEPTVPYDLSQKEEEVVIMPPPPKPPVKIIDLTDDDTDG